ncbi:MAG: outer membrane protein [Rhizobiaceae bacterium]
MRKLLLATTFLVGSTFGALAEGHSSAYDWTGFYAGVFVGYGSGDTRWFTPALTTPTFNMDGWLGGVAVGVNYQIDQFVIGAEADVAFSNIDGLFVPIPCLTGCITDMEAFGTVRARAGWAIDNVLLYVTGGYAWANISETLIGAGASSSTRSGWAAGGGVDWAFNSDILGGGWFARAEYQYMDFGGRLAPIVGGINVNADDFHTGRIGIFKKF